MSKKKMKVEPIWSNCIILFGQNKMTRMELECSGCNWGGIFKTCQDSNEMNCSSLFYFLNWNEIYESLRIEWNKIDNLSRNNFNYGNERVVIKIFYQRGDNDNNRIDYID
jgi:hypothetical protein